MSTTTKRTITLSVSSLLALVPNAATISTLEGIATLLSFTLTDEEIDSACANNAQDQIETGYSFTGYRKILIDFRDQYIKKKEDNNVGISK